MPCSALTQNIVKLLFCFFNLYLNPAPFMAAAFGKSAFKLLALFGAHTFPFGFPHFAAAPVATTAPESAKKYF